MSNVKEQTSLKIEGHVLIHDLLSGECILNKRNAINYENMSILIANSLSYGNIFGIQKMAFGNGGVTIDSLGSILYKPTNTSNTTAELYNETYEVLVSNDPNQNEENNIIVSHESGNTFSDVIITATLGYNEPSGPVSDNITNVVGEFIFNEIGLKDLSGNLVTHIIFHPILKSSNRKIQIVYTIRIMVGA